MLRGEENISELCRREGIAASMYYGWSKESPEAGKRRTAAASAASCGAIERQLNLSTCTAEKRKQAVWNAVLVALNRSKKMDERSEPKLASRRSALALFG